MATICCEKTQFPHIQAVIFDKDGTLADSQGYLRRLCLTRSQLIATEVPGIQNALLSAFGVDHQRVNPAGLMAVGTRQENEIAAAAYVAATGRTWLDSLNLVKVAFTQADTQMPAKVTATPLFQGARRVLNALHQADVRVGVLSSDSTFNVREFVEYYKLQTFVQLQLGTDGHLSKPDPAFFDQACQLLGVSPAHTLMVGDSTADIQMAQSTGAKAVGVTWGWKPPPDLGQADALIDCWTKIDII